MNNKMEWIIWIGIVLTIGLIIYANYNTHCTQHSQPVNPDNVMDSVDMDCGGSEWHGKEGTSEYGEYEPLY